jgi:hypothetical protein
MPNTQNAISNREYQNVPISGKTFAELIQEGARPELGSWTLLHLSHQDRPTSARMKRSRCSLPADESSSFLESDDPRFLREQPGQCDLCGSCVFSPGDLIRRSKQYREAMDFGEQACWMPTAMLCLRIPDRHLLPMPSRGA